jgi:hypothetical protein
VIDEAATRGDYERARAALLSVRGIRDGATLACALSDLIGDPAASSQALKAVTVEAERVIRADRQAEATRRLDRLEARFGLTLPGVAEGLGLRSKAVGLAERADRIESLFGLIAEARRDVLRYKSLFGIDVYGR